MSLTEKDPKYEEKIEKLKKANLQQEWLYYFIDEGIEHDKDICKKIAKYQNRDFKNANNNTKKLREKVTKRFLGDDKIENSKSGFELIKYMYVNAPFRVNKKYLEKYKILQRYKPKEDFENEFSSYIVSGKLPENFTVYVKKIILPEPKIGFEAFRSTFEIEEPTVYVRESIVSIPRYGYEPRTLPTVNDLFYTGENGGYIGCYSRDKELGVCHFGGSVYIIGQIWLEGRYRGVRFEPSGYEGIHEGIEDVSTIPELNKLCDRAFPHAKGDCSAGNETGGWFEGRADTE